jgi:glutathione peroxidase
MLKLLILSGMMMAMVSSIYDFKVPSLDGGTIDFSKYKGKKI